MRLRFEHGRRDELKTLNPAYFAMVMATGIVSIAAHLHAVPLVPTVLLWLNGVFFVALAAAGPRGSFEMTSPRMICSRGFESLKRI